MNWARYITGWVTAEVSGAEPEKFLYALAERGITFWGATPPKNFALTVQMPLQTKKLVTPLAASVGCEAVVCGWHGVPALVHKVRRRWMLLGCLALTVLLLVWSGAFIWDIQVEGNETIPEGVIRQALAECGVDIGSYWPGFSQDQIRNSVILRVPGIRWMTVTVRGSHARVIIRESREHLPLVDEKTYVKIVAAKAGLVEDVQALRGTAEKEPGQIALPEEVLIGGYMTGRVSVLGATRAIGTVTARTWYELTAQAPLEEAGKAYTGSKRSRWALIFGKTRINFYKDSSICPAGCDKITNVYTLGWDGVFTLPVTVERTVLTAYESSARSQPSLRDELEVQLLERLEQTVGDEGEILSVTFTASERDGIMYVTLRGECREQIGREVPLTEADLYEIQMKIPRTEEKDP